VKVERVGNRKYPQVSWLYGAGSLEGLYPREIPRELFTLANSNATRVEQQPAEAIDSPGVSTGITSIGRPGMAIVSA